MREKLRASDEQNFKNFLETPLTAQILFERLRPKNSGSNFFVRFFSPLQAKNWDIVCGVTPGTKRQGAGKN